MFYKISVLKNFAKFTRKHLCWSLCNLILKGDSSTGGFLQILWSFSVHFFHRTLPDNCFWHFIAIALLKKNLSDVSTIGCLIFFGDFLYKHQQLSLLFLLRFQFISKYLKSQNKWVLLQTFSSKPYLNFMHFFTKKDAVELW